MLLWTLKCVCLCLFEIVVSFSLDIYQGMELLDRLVVLFLVFGETSMLFSIVAAPIYIPTNRVLQFPFLHILTNTCYLRPFWQWPFWQVWGGSSLFWFTFLWWWALLSILSCVCLPHIYLLWRNYFGLLPIFWIGCLFFDVELYELFIYFGY